LNRIPRRTLALLPAAVLILTLALLFWGGGGARAMFQVSPLSTPISPLSTPTPPLPATPAPGGVASPTVEAVPSLEPPTSVPLPSTVGPTATVEGFLPAPTIVDPNDLKSLPLAQPPVSGSGGEPDEPAPATPTPVPSRSVVQTVVAVINSLWLLCAALLVVGGAVAIYLIWRRGQQT